MGSSQKFSRAPAQVQTTETGSPTQKMFVNLPSTISAGLAYPKSNCDEISQSLTRRIESFDEIASVLQTARSSPIVKSSIPKTVDNRQHSRQLQIDNQGEDPTSKLRGHLGEGPSTDLTNSLLESSKHLTDLAVVESNNELDKHQPLNPSPRQGQASNLSDEAFLRAIGEKILRDGRQLQDYVKIIQEQTVKTAQLEEALKTSTAKDQVSEQRNEVQELEVKKLAQRYLMVHSLFQDLAKGHASIGRRP
jgi:hypothetical protein